LRTFKIMTSGQQETVALGSVLARRLRAGDVVCLFGDLGTGKTTFVKGLASGLRIPSRRVHSPSFVLMNIYQGRVPLYHFDLYRLDTLEEIRAIGYEEFLYGDGIAVVEWADKMGTLIPDERINVFLSHRGEDKRLLEFKPSGSRYREVLESFKAVKT